MEPEIEMPVIGDRILRKTDKDVTAPNAIMAGAKSFLSSTRDWTGFAMIAKIIVASC